MADDLTCLTSDFVVLGQMYSNKALALSDMDATYFELEQTALERSLQSDSNLEHGKKQKATNRARGRHVDTPSSEVSNLEGHVDSPSQVCWNCGSESVFSYFSQNSHETCSVSLKCAVAALPSSSSSSSSSSEAEIPPAASVAAKPASASVSAGRDDREQPSVLGAVDEYPQTVQELVMNGFELRRVVRAYELIGDNFDDLLSFLVSTSN